MTTLQSKYASLPPNRQSSAKPPPRDPTTLSTNHKPDHIVGIKNSFNEIQKRKFFQNIAESQDIYFGRRQEPNATLFTPVDDNDKSIAHQAENLPPCAYDQRKRGVARADITEEGLDDWMAQSINRSIPEMLDPKKKFQVPYTYLDDLKKRYPHMIPQVEPVCEDEEEQFLRSLLEDESIVDRKTLEEKKKQYRRQKNKHIYEQMFQKQQQQQQQQQQLKEQKEQQKQQQKQEKAKSQEEKKKSDNTKKSKNTNEFAQVKQLSSQQQQYHAKDKAELSIDSKKLEPKFLVGQSIKAPLAISNPGNNSSSTDALQKFNFPTQSSNKNTPYSHYSGYNPRVSVTAQQKKRYNTNNTQGDDSVDLNESKSNLRPVSHDGARQQQTAQAARSLFTLNISNFLRKSNNEQNIETSIAEKELIYIEGVMNQQNERKQLEQLTREQKKQSIEYFKDIQKQNRKELNRIVNDAITYCQNPPDIGNMQPILTNNSQAATKDKRPQSHSSTRGQSRGTQKRFFILTKLQSKPSTAQSGQRVHHQNNASNVSTHQQFDKMDQSAYQTRQSFYQKTNYQTEEQDIPIRKTQNFFDSFQNGNFIKVQNDSPLRNSFYPSSNQDPLSTSFNKFFETTNNNNNNNSNQNANSTFYYSSLRSYKQNKINEMRQRITLKELTKDYINQDQNKGTSIFPQTNVAADKPKSRIKSTSLHNNNSSFTSNFYSNYNTNTNHNESVVLKKTEIQNNSILQGNSGSKQEKKSADLPEQVERLLNSGSEDCLIKPNDDFANLVLHLEEMPITQKKTENQMTNAEFWFYKSWKLIEKGQTEVATQCLKQVLIQDKLHFKSIFNMGSLYEKTKKFNTALEWLKISQKFDENQEQTIFGIALCQYKLRNFEESYENINKLIQKIKEKDEPPSRYIYLRALCLKQLERIQEAEEDYKIFYKFTSPKNFDLLMHFMILFSFKYKNKIAKYQDLEIKYSSRTFCNFHSAVQQILQGEYFEMKLGNFYKQSVGWQNEDELLVKLQGLSFFKRFALPLLKKALPYFIHNLIEKEKLINPSDNEIYIIIAGNVQVFDHSKNYEKPDIVSYYSEGDIIGCDQLENNLSKKPNVWLISQTPVEYIKMQKNLFLDLWKGQYSLEGEKVTSLLRNCPIFKGISEISMLKLSYELVSMEEFNKNEIIYNDGTYLDTMNFNYIEMKKVSHKRGAGMLKRIIQKMTSYSNALYRMTKLRKLLQKHKQRIKKFMWKSKIIKGFYIIVEGVVELENDGGWSYLLTPGDFFGENLMFKVKALSNFGRLRAASNTVKALFLPREEFNQINSLDKAIMKKNCKNREQIHNIEYQANRSAQIRSLKMKRRKEEEERQLKNQTDEEYIQSIMEQ